MRVIIGERITDKTLWDGDVKVGKPIELEFPVHPSKIRVAIVNEKKIGGTGKTLVLLFES